MSQTVEKTAKTVQEAIVLALEELGASEDDVEIEIIDEGNKGIFGIGSKYARVQVTLKSLRSDDAVSFLENVLSKMKVEVDIKKIENDESIMLKISGKDSGIIIGRHGETLDALQYLTNLAVNRRSGDYKRVSIDIENYRQKREDALVKLADRLAERVVRYRKNVTLEPMNPYERRIIHSTLQNNRLIETHSVGEEPNRKVVITLKQGMSGRGQ